VAIPCHRDCSTLIVGVKGTQEFSKPENPCSTAFDSSSSRRSRQQPGNGQGLKRPHTSMRENRRDRMLNHDSRQENDLSLTREAWLHRAIETFRPRFAEIGLPLPRRLWS
jgi:hypothetical protein